MDKMVLVLYGNLRSAHGAVQDLLNRGQPQESIGLITDPPSRGKEKKTLVEAMVGASIEESIRQQFVQGVLEGGTLLSVRVSNRQVGRVTRLLDSYNPVVMAASIPPGDPIEDPSPPGQGNK
jgi:hypothetical protein